MAEFKLGRIRFVWKGDWVAGTVYYKDDIIRNGGNTYLCIQGHTATNDFTNDVPPNWNKISDGQEWKGDWTTDTYYKINDIVKYGSMIYIANTAHTSASTATDGLELNQSYWDSYAEGFDWKDVWTTNTRYKVNDIVKYNGLNYLCITAHTSAATNANGLEADQANWDLFTEGTAWQGDWSINVRYRKNDIVKYGGYLYICNTGHTSAGTIALGLENDQSSWDTFNPGLEYKGVHTASTRYKLNDIVKHGAGLYICITPHTSTGSLLNDEANWNIFVEGLEFEDSWRPQDEYQIGDLVTYGGYTYVAATNHSEVRPTDGTGDWELFNTGFRFVGDWGDDSSNQDYRTGDVVRHGGYSYLAIADNNNQEPPNITYWERLNQGINWTGAWTNATPYILGDAVSINDNSYICVLAHTSDEVTDQNRPDQDTVGTYWNLLAGGAEVNVMTTDGDLVYYSGTGPARLPIGPEGSVLKVNTDGTLPEWAYVGQINNVFYVSVETGIDNLAPTNGVTIDRPWKTIKYGLQQIDRGAVRGNSRHLIERNISFIIDEASLYFNTVEADTGAQTNFRTIYSGVFLNAIFWDLTHGGNQKSRALALEYAVDATLQSFAASYNSGFTYIKDLVDAVLSNVPPATVRGAIPQYTNGSVTEEADAQSTVDSLVTIVTDAVTAGNTNSIPSEKIANNTLFVKTGNYEENLPLNVPANTAVVGDELRSTRISAAGAVVDVADVPYSLDGISRIIAIVGDIVQNNAVSASAGNAETQVTTRTSGGATNATNAIAAAQAIYDYINWEINSAGTAPTLSGQNDRIELSTVDQAVEILEVNRTFIQEEVIAYIAVTYPAYVYDENKCRRDVSRYIDAIQADLYYQSNYKSILAGRSYVNAVNSSVLEDMFYLRNGTGLRNCTVAGLSGQLGSANSYGTKRPTAGAYCSLDPGWGTTHEEVWISTRSPYVQNVTTFGTGCIGMKVDGDLHDGGNDSIVANDFTQILSDGIGAWVTNLGRAELVSVFSYYGHIGYLAENGGKIRATNGNSSYGDFGTVAEGVDPTETPITGTVTNRNFEATVNSVLTDGNQILALEYLNAGVNYTSGGTTIAIGGEGIGATVSTVNTVNGGVYEVRMLDDDNNADNEPDTGGAGYVFSQNTAQGGNTTQIQISNTDSNSSATYVGMAVWIINGTGAGQYAYIDTYSSGTKIATVRRYSDGAQGWDSITGATIQAVLDESTTYSIEPRVVFTGGSPSQAAVARAIADSDQIAEVRILIPGAGYSSTPTVSFTDPNNTLDAPVLARIGNGVLSQPTFSSRGTGYVTATASVDGDGYMDRYQPGGFLVIEGLGTVPQAGSNLTIAGIANTWFKVVNVQGIEGTGPYKVTVKLSPDITISDAPEHGEGVEFAIRYSQVRLTGHDFLDIGTGNFGNTNYPGIPLISPDPDKETNDFGGGRVFYTSTDQDGNFRVGDLFSVEQSTGVASLNADAFNISGLQELQLGSVSLGGSNAVITEFSTDGNFTANSDSIVPTQKAIKTYIASQIGGGAGELNVNSIQAGQIIVTSNTIDSIGVDSINMLTKMNFKGDIDGSPVALKYFLFN